MGTKNNPGDFDCYKRLLPDEPYFLVRAKDASAPYLTQMWACLRRGDWSGAVALVHRASCDDRVLMRVGDGTNPKLAEAYACAEQMTLWNHDNVCEHGILLDHVCRDCDGK